MGDGNIIIIASVMMTGTIDCSLGMTLLYLDVLRVVRRLITSSPVLCVRIQEFLQFVAP